MQRSSLVTAEDVQRVADSVKGAGLGPGGAQLRPKVGDKIDFVFEQPPRRRPSRPRSRRRA
ncbi:MAG: hypothetical protein QM767_07115 [Anaeromyxobacter sp.]